jgi:hypothetical protein
MSEQITRNLVSAAQRINTNSAPCGIGAGLQSLNESIDRATTQINQAISQANDIVAAIQSLPSVITRELTTVATQMIDGLVGEIRTSIALPDEVRTLMSAINNPAAFLQQYLRIERLFPDFDLNALLAQISLPGFNFCSMVPNLQTSANEVTEEANEIPPASTDAEPQPEPAPIPTPEIPPEQPNTSARAQRIIIEELPPVGENAGLTEEQRQARRSQYAQELDENNNQRAAILAQLENSEPGSAGRETLIEEARRLTEISRQIRSRLE